MTDDDEQNQLRAAALQNVQSILRARQRAEDELNKTKEALEEEARMLELLNKIGTSLTSNLDLQVVVQTMVDAATELSGAEFGAFYRTLKRDDGKERFALFALSSGAERAPFDCAAELPVTRLLAPTYRGQGTVRISNLGFDERSVGRGFGGAPGAHLPLCSYLAVPVVARAGQVIGGLFFGHRLSDMFSARSERVIAGIAAQAAIAIDNARLYEDAMRAADERSRLYEIEHAARAELERASRIKDEFLGTLSHELRTPLSAILGWSQVLLARVSSDDAGMRDGLSTILRNARAQAQLIDDLLDMSRIVAGKVRLDMHRVDLAAVLASALDSLRPTAAAKDVSIRASFEAKGNVIHADPSRLQQIVWNLLTNAIKFTPKGGVIELMTRRSDAQLELIVHDSGIGISAEFLPHMFQRFRQADSSTTRHYGGLGLGLSIVRQLVELHGGTVRAESDGTNRGATFTVALPVRASPGLELSHDLPHSTRPPEPAPQEPVWLEGTTVLVVDDEHDARELMRTLLCDAGAKVLLGSSAAEGLALLLSQRPDLIVSDIGMPGRDGYAFMHDVRALEPSAGGDTVAIALSALTGSDYRIRALLAGYQLHLAKPVEPRELLAAVRSLSAQRGRVGSSSVRPAQRRQL